MCRLDEPRGGRLKTVWPCRSLWPPAPWRSERCCRRSSILPTEQEALRQRLRAVVGTSGPGYAVGELAPAASGPMSPPAHGGRRQELAIAHSRVDRHQPLLPPPARRAEVDKVFAGRGVAPVPWRHLVCGLGTPPCRIAPLGPVSKVVLTVARQSFDAQCPRELTARSGAGGRVCRRGLMLLEEPQAAVLWPGWPTGVNAGGGNSSWGDTLLVCERGWAATTDFTLGHRGRGRGANWVLRRMAVGNHLLLGGDKTWTWALAHHCGRRHSAKKGSRSILGNRWPCGISCSRPPKKC